MNSTILIIEDEPDIRNILREILEFEGFSVCTAANGHEALDLLTRIEAPRLILLDLLMPVMNGSEFRKAQLSIPKIASIPVIVMSADRTPRVKLGDEKIPCLSKPLELTTLLREIQKFTRSAS